MYQRAYSRYSATWASLVAAFNFVEDVEGDRYCTDPFRDGNRMLANGWLAGLQRDGYRIKVYQNSYLDLAAPLPKGSVTTADYASNSLGFMGGTGWGLATRARCLVGLYAHRAFLVQEALRAADAVASLGGGPGLPAGYGRLVKLAPLTAAAMLDDVACDLAAARPGEAYLAHVLMPHSPFAYRGDGALRPEPWTWEPVPGAPVDTARVFAHYFEQMSLVDRRVAAILDTLRAGPHWDDALVIVHGDHGGRIRHNQQPTWTPRSPYAEDQRDSYATLAAVKLPRGRARAVAGPVALDALMAAVAARDSAWLAAPPPAPVTVFAWEDPDHIRRALRLFPGWD